MIDEETEERMKKLPCRKKGECGLQQSQESVCLNVCLISGLARCIVASQLQSLSLSFGSLVIGCAGFLIFLLCPVALLTTL